MLETALNPEMTEHLGPREVRPAGSRTGNVRNGTRAETVLTESSGQMSIQVPRDRERSSEPQIVSKDLRKNNP